MGLLSQLEAREQSRRVATRQSTGSLSPSSPPTPPVKPVKPTSSHREFVLSCSVAVPAVPMVVIVTHLDDHGKDFSQSFPVIGVETSIRHRWWRREPSGKSDYREYPTESDLEAAGYQFTEQEVRHSPLVVDPDFDIISIADLKAVLGDSDRFEWRVRLPLSTDRQCCE